MRKVKRRILGQNGLPCLTYQAVRERCDGEFRMDANGIWMQSAGKGLCCTVAPQWHLSFRWKIGFFGITNLQLTSFSTTAWHLQLSVTVVVVYSDVTNLSRQVLLSCNAGEIVRIASLRYPICSIW